MGITMTFHHSVQTYVDFQTLTQTETETGTKPQITKKKTAHLL